MPTPEFRCECGHLRGNHKLHTAGYFEGLYANCMLPPCDCPEFRWVEAQTSTNSEQREANSDGNGN